MTEPWRATLSRLKRAATVFAFLALIGPPLAFLLLTLFDLPLALFGQENKAIALLRGHGTFATLALLLFLSYAAVLPLVIVPALLAAAQTWGTDSFGTWTILIGTGVAFLVAGLTRLRFIFWAQTFEQRVLAFVAVVAALWLCRRMLLWACLIKTAGK